MSTTSLKHQTEQSTVLGFILERVGFVAGFLFSTFCRSVKSPCRENAVEPTKRVAKVPPPAKPTKTWTPAEIESIPAVLRKSGQSASAWLQQKGIDDNVSETDAQLSLWEET
jgi:hypothetical protein